MKKAALLTVLALLTLPIAYNVTTSYLSDADYTELPRIGSQFRLWEVLAWSDICLLPGLPVFRPITWLILALMTRIFGVHFHLYQASLFSCHLLNAVLLYLLAFRLTRNKACALIAGLLFFFSQLSTEILCRPFSNTMIHAVTFTLLTLIYVAGYCASGRRVHLLAVLLFFNMALYTNETCLALLLYIPLLIKVFFPRTLSASRKAVLFLWIALSTAFLLAVWMLPRAGLSHSSIPTFDFRVFGGNVLWSLATLFLPYEDMCYSPSGTFFIALYFLLGYAYVFAFGRFLAVSRGRNRLFLFGAACLLLYVVPLSKLTSYERPLYGACPFFALVIGSLLTVGEWRTRRGYRISVMALCALLLANNYSLLLLRTRDWSTVGGLTREIMRFFGDRIDEIRGRKLHAVSLYPHRLLYLRGKPLFGPIDEMYLNCLWFNGRDPGEFVIYGEDLVLWRDAREIALAYKFGGPVREDDPLIALTTEREKGSYRFRLYEGTAGDFLRGRLAGVERPGSSFPVRVNFQLVHSFVPLPGFEIDEGKAYQPWRGFGWDREICGDDLAFQRKQCVDPDTRDRAVQLRDTFVFTQGGTATWRIDLPNGDYRVSLCWGSAMGGRPPQSVTLQGAVVARNENRPRAGEFVTAENIPVSVTDGRMLMEIIPRWAHGWPVINYLVIERDAAAPPEARGLHGGPVNPRRG